MPDNKPTFLFVFTFPDGSVDRMTGDDITRGFPNYGAAGVTVAGNVFRYAPISFGNIKQTNQVKKQELTLTVPLSDTTGRKLVDAPEPETVSLTILRADVAGAVDPFNPEILVAWSGTVGGASVKKETISIVGVNIFASLQLSGNRVRYSRLCRHALYGAGCGLGTGPYQQSGTLDGFTGVQVNILASPTIDVATLVGGLLIYGTTRYFVLSAQLLSPGSFRLNLDRPFVEIPGTTSLAVAPGCDRTQETCSARFNNLENFGGFPYIPSKNPFTVSAIV